MKTGKQEKVSIYLNILSLIEDDVKKNYYKKIESFKKTIKKDILQNIDKISSDKAKSKAKDWVASKWYDMSKDIEKIKILEKKAHINLNVLADKYPYELKNMGKEDVKGDREKNLAHRMIEEITRIKRGIDVNK